MSAAAVLIGAAWTTGAAGSQKTTRDRVYSKDQAARGEKQYRQICGRCHDPGREVTPGKKPSPILIGDPFFDEWQDRTLGELSTGIKVNMPPDGSVVLTAEETADLVAYLLKVNGLPDGPADLKIDPSTREIVIVK